MRSPSNLKQNLILGKVATLGAVSITFMRQPYLYVRAVNEEGECVVARAHPESDSVTGAGHKQVPTGCAQDESEVGMFYIHNALF